MQKPRLAEIVETSRGFPDHPVRKNVDSVLRADRIHHILKSVSDSSALSQGRTSAGDRCATAVLSPSSHNKSCSSNLYETLADRTFYPTPSLRQIRSCLNLIRRRSRHQLRLCLSPYRHKAFCCTAQKNRDHLFMRFYSRLVPARASGTTPNERSFCAGFAGAPEAPQRRVLEAVILAMCLDVIQWYIVVVAKATPPEVSKDGAGFSQGKRQTEHYATWNG